MKTRVLLLTALTLAAFLLPLAVTPASAFYSGWCQTYPYELNGGGVNFTPALFMPQPPPPGLPDAPIEHTDGRLNYRDCRAPLAVFLDEDGNVDVWTTDENNMYVKLDLILSATPDEIADALALAEEMGEDVVIAGYVDGFALIAKPDGSLKAELIGVYGFDFYFDGSENNGFGLPYEESPFVF